MQFKKIIFKIPIAYVEKGTMEWPLCFNAINAKNGFTIAVYLLKLKQSSKWILTTAWVNNLFNDKDVV
jgi:hypothetical protein